MKTLAEINARLAEMGTRERGSYVVQYVAAVGSMSMSTFRAHQMSGTKVHQVSGYLVVGYVGDFQPTRRQAKIGDILSGTARCNGNGQTCQKIFRELDTDAINCQRCLR